MNDSQYKAHSNELRDRNYRLSKSLMRIDSEGNKYPHHSYDQDAIVTTLNRLTEIVENVSHDLDLLQKKLVVAEREKVRAEQRVKELEDTGHANILSKFPRTCSKLSEGLTGLVSRIGPQYENLIGNIDTNVSKAIEFECRSVTDKLDALVKQLVGEQGRFAQVTKEIASCERKIVNGHPIASDYNDPR